MDTSDIPVVIKRKKEFPIPITIVLLLLILFLYFICRLLILLVILKIRERLLGVYGNFLLLIVVNMAIYLPVIMLQFVIRETKHL